MASRVFVSCLGLVAVAAHGARRARGGVEVLPRGRSVEPSLTAELWREFLPEAEAALREPFLAGLANGTLPPAVFDRYIRQDDLYLTIYARAMSAHAARVPREDSITFLFLANESLNAYSEHDPFSNKSAGGAQMSSVNTAYTDLLMAATQAPALGLGMVSAVPCAKLYAWVGAQLFAQGAAHPGNPYAGWIKAYAAEGSQVFASNFESLVDKYAHGLTERERDEARRTYGEAMSYERGFFADALQSVSLPLPPRVREVLHDTAAPATQSGSWHVPEFLQQTVAAFVGVIAAHYLLPRSQGARGGYGTFEGGEEKMTR
eukprot:Hpha_TRINITY_DN6161_c0_g1::TRINITY_DN6161_c0_g1_i1::g.164827::m.164827/K03707/tenA; thiaminase (transcriptional activator TenA)